jgi:hypothetical protein
MTPADRIALLNRAILAVRPIGMLAEAVLVPLQTLRDDLAAELPPVAPGPVLTQPGPAPKDAPKDAPKPWSPAPGPTEPLAPAK